MTTPNLAPGVNAPTLAAKAAHDAAPSAEADLRPVPLPEGLLLAAYVICLSAPQPGARRVAAQLLEAINATPREDAD